MGKKYFIHNEIAVDEDTVEILTNNSEVGDKYVELRRGERFDGKGPEYWLETNGGPRVISLDETDWACSIEQAAEVIGMDADELRRVVETNEWQ